MPTKQQLRKEFLQKRKAIHSQQKLKQDDLLLIQFQNLYFPTTTTLLTYFPIPHQAEPNTIAFTNYLRHTIPNLQIAYPVCNFDDNTMQAILINEQTIYKTNSYGIAEPKEGPILNTTDIDLVFVPLICYDKQGYRVGFGKGFYDKYLSQCKSECIFLGFSYFDPVEKIDDVNHLDIPLHYCITPHQVYEF